MEKQHNVGLSWVYKQQRHHIAFIFESFEALICIKMNILSFLGHGCHKVIYYEYFILGMFDWEVGWCTWFGWPISDNSQNHTNPIYMLQILSMSNLKAWDLAQFLNSNAWTLVRDVVHFFFFRFQFAF